jgi:pimeloyl-ACP methyl ester carboxylesterase
LLDLLPEGMHAIAVDFPGAGSSERRKNLDVTMGATAGTVQQLLDALELDRPCLLGHSHGAAIALRLAQTCPERLRSLVLLSPAHPYFKESDPVIRFYLSLPGRLFAHTMPWYPRWVQMMGLRRMAGPQSWDMPSRLTPYRENLRRPGTISHLLRLLRSWHVDMAELRRMLRQPVSLATLIVWGDADRAVPVDSAKELQAHIERSVLRVLPGVGHRPAEERSEFVAGMLADWMECADLTARTYSPNVSVNQDRIAAFMTPSFEAGD